MPSIQFIPTTWKPSLYIRVFTCVCVKTSVLASLHLQKCHSNGTRHKYPETQLRRTSHSKREFYKVNTFHSARLFSHCGPLIETILYKQVIWSFLVNEGIESDLDADMQRAYIGLNAKSPKEGEANKDSADPAWQDNRNESKNDESSSSSSPNSQGYVYYIVLSSYS